MSMIAIDMELTHQNPGAVTKRLDRWSQVFGSNIIVKTIEKQLDITYETMYRMAPVKTGYLRSTINIKSGADYAQIGVTAYYAYYLHTGTRGRPMNPFWKTSVAGLAIETIVLVRNLFQGNF